MGGPAALPRAALRVGGISIARHQLAILLAAGCERIVCLVSQLDGTTAELQHTAEATGAQFHALVGLRGLAALVTVADEVIALRDGMLPDPATALALIEGGAAVQVQPETPALSEGFERIDGVHADAGLIRVPGRLVERLRELPGDADAYSGLLRAGLQAGTPRRELPREVLLAGRWRLVRSEAEAQTVEPRWIAAHLTTGDTASPGSALAALGVQRFAPAMLHSGSAGMRLGIGAELLVLLGVVVGWLGQPAVGLGVCALAWPLQRAGAMIERIERSALRRAQGWLRGDAVFGWLFDAALLALGTLALPPFPGEPLLAHVFAPAMLIALVRIVPAIAPPRIGVWIADRMMLCLALTGATLAGVTGPVMASSALVLAAIGIFAPNPAARLTSV